MFKDVIIGSIGIRLKVKKGLIMVCSFLLHSTIIFAVLIGPMLKTDTNFSEVKVVDIFLAKSPPLPPRAMSGKTTEKDSKSSRVKKELKENQPKAIPPKIGKLLAPVKIPDEIIDEDLEFDMDLNNEIGDGIEGATNIGINDELPDIPGLKIPLDNNSSTRISVKQARRTKYVPPIYPGVAKNAKITGSVIIEAKTDVFGKVISWRVISGHPILNSAAINAVRRWEYEPYLIGGVPKPVVFTVTINFTLNK